MKKRFLFAAIVALSSASAFAGFKSNVETSIVRSGTTTYAFGAMGATRDSADSVQYIGCDYSANGTPAILCTARTADNQSFSCTSYDADMRDAAFAMTSSSWIRFAVDTTVSWFRCSHVLVSNNSKHAPPQP